MIQFEIPPSYAVLPVAVNCAADDSGVFFGIPEFDQPVSNIMIGDNPPPQPK